MKTLTTILALVIAGAYVRCWAEPRSSCSSSGLDTKVPGTFAANESLARGILELGQLSHVCFGLRILDANAFEHVLHIRAKDTSVRQILAAMVRELPNYTFQESAHKVVLVGKLDLKIPDLLLDKVVPSFDTPRAPLNTVSNALRMQVAVNLDPTINGFVGMYSSGDSADAVGPINERGRMVWELLNEIVGHSRGAMWISSVPESRKSYPELQYWQVIEYTMPPQSALAAIQEAASQFHDVRDPE